MDIKQLGTKHNELGEVLHSETIVHGDFVHPRVAI
jgi:hypothetical protein